jgi:hypothetical protein
MRNSSRKHQVSIILVIVLLGICSGLIIGCSDNQGPVQPSTTIQMSDSMRDGGAVARSATSNYTTCDPRFWLPGVPFVTPGELRRNPRAYDGQRVGMISRPVVFTTSCDGWNWRDSCGQDCVALFGIVDSGVALLQLFDADGKAWLCTGNNCNLYDDCYPMIPHCNTPYYWLVGVVHDYTVYSDRPWFRMHVEQYGVLPFEI